MNSEVGEKKALLREQVRAETRRLPASARAQASRLACANVRGIPPWRVATCLLLYMPVSEEVDVRELLTESLEAGKVVSLPRFEPSTQGYVACQVKDLHRDLIVGRFGIPEPRESCSVVSLNRLDFVTVPGVAFDLDGWRLGRGKGYYDRLLASVSGTKCGVALDEQLVVSIPLEAHDTQLDWIVTPTRSVRVSERAARF